MVSWATCKFMRTSLHWDRWHPHEPPGAGHIGPFQVVFLVELRTLTCGTGPRVERISRLPRVPRKCQSRALSCTRPCGHCHWAFLGSSYLLNMPEVFGELVQTCQIDQTQTEVSVRNLFLISDMTLTEVSVMLLVTSGCSSMSSFLLGWWWR